MSVRSGCGWPGAFRHDTSDSTPEGTAPGRGSGTAGTPSRADGQLERTGQSVGRLVDQPVGKLSEVLIRLLSSVPDSVSTPLLL